MWDRGKQTSNALVFFRKCIKIVMSLKYFNIKNYDEDKIYSAYQCIKKEAEDSKWSLNL